MVGVNEKWEEKNNFLLKITYLNPADALLIVSETPI